MTPSNPQHTAWNGTIAAALGVSIMAAATMAAAQPQTAAPPESHPPAACAAGERLERRDMRPDTPIAPGETLSDKLARTEGVLCPPPRIDPQMAEQPPAGGALRVIPPPGSSPADPVQPK
jgi:hypothetical protein